MIAAVANQFLAEIVSESDRLTRLVEQLLDLSRIETGLVQQQRELVAIGQIAQAVWMNSTGARQSWCSAQAGC